MRFSVSPEVVQLTAVPAGKSAVATPSVYLTDKTELKTFKIKILTLEKVNKLKCHKVNAPVAWFRFEPQSIESLSVRSHCPAQSEIFAEIFILIYKIKRIKSNIMLRHG